MIEMSLVIAAVIFLSTTTDWPHWRGTTRNGVSEEPSHFQGDSWLSDKPQWEVEVGEGANSPIVGRGLVFVMGWRDDKEHVTAIDLQDGTIRWSQAYDAPLRGRNATGDESFYSGPSPTAEYDQTHQRLFTLGCDGELRCWNAEDGALIWRVALHDQFEIPQRDRIGRSGQRDYGFTSAPLLLGEQLIVEVGSREGTLMGFAPDTGATLWKSQATEPAGHSGGPVPITVDGVPCVVVLALHHLIVTRIDEGHAGETVATYQWETSFANNIPTPAVHGQSVLITTKYNHEAICRVDVTLQGADRIWETNVASGVCSPVVHEGRVFWSSHEMFCLNFETGEVIWSGGRYGDAGSCLVTQDDRAIVWAGRGILSLVDVSADSAEYRELYRREFQLPSDAWPHLALSDGVLLLKTREGRLMGFRL